MRSIAAPGGFVQAMRGYAYTVRPAGAAIAAVLAICSTISVAQEAPGTTPPAESVVPPPASAPAPDASPAFAPVQPVIQPTPSVEERLAASVAASEAEAADRQAAPAAQAERRSAPVRQEAARPEAAPIRPVQPTPVADKPAVASIPRTAASEPSPVMAPAPESAPMPEADGATDPALYWGLGGAALLLLGIGGATALRRRRYDEQRDVMETAVPVVPEHMQMMERPVSAAVAGTRVPASQATTLDEMVAAPPSEENPFRTHKKRMTRARFLLAQREGPTGSSANAVADATWSSAPAARREESQTVYRFGSERSGSASFKPQTR